MKILHLTTSLGLGGAERALFELVKNMRRLDINSTVVSMTSGGSYVQRLSELGIQVSDLAMRRATPDPRKLFEFARIVDEQRPDLIQSWMYHANLLASTASVARLVQVPLVWNVRHSLENLSNEKLGLRMAIWLSSVLSRNPQLVVFNSSASLDQHVERGFPRGKCQVIPNGFDCDRFRPDQRLRERTRRELGIGEGQVAILNVARLHPIKGHSVLLGAASQLAMDAEYVFLLAGPGVSVDADVFADCSSGPLSRSVRLLGPREDVAALMNAADLFCLPSLSEGFPNVVGEAMATGTPCLVTDVGDAAWVVGNTGTVVAARDATAIAAAIREFSIMEREARKRLGMAARRRIEDCFKSDRVVDRYANLYRSVSSSRLESP